ncbi:low molecular weight protein-tyrosine-phosphatase [Shewanella baltica]|uniref:low molecular weight protein-tyrosine-phosphatase n=1 Tax=Shewanella baltica TaxID=62322 RepID=UPI00217CF13A|nr:low molecular weight protein-tyrosine-phosphatase [Shewanella baltica]MCS6095614.1 low molecular weight phosphotyrosine protein phosphatase [Shewanella baltica]MCS6226925.1 low molecular weight phosphotyrosine protein phosphatase [Shewanella baltica]
MKEARVQRILMVCMGNICRSPTAQAVCRFKVAERKLNIEVDSAGTIGYHQGDTPDSRAMAAGKKRGFSFDGMRARQVVDADFEHFDLILAADKANLADLRSRCPLEYQYKLQLMLSYADTQVTEVPDPYYGGEQGFELVLDLLEHSMDALLDRLTSGPQK